MSFLFFNSRSTSFKRPFGALKTGDQAELRLRLPKDAGYSAPRLLLFQADSWEKPQVLPMSLFEIRLSCNLYSCTFSLPTPQLCFYCFEVDHNGKAVRLSRGAGSEAIFSEEATQLWQLTVYSAAFETPDFLKGGLIYQIFPDRFCRSNLPKAHVPPDRHLHQAWDDMPEYLPNELGKITNSDYFSGDLPGVLSKMDYLQELGVTCIYLNPVFEAHSNHRYNTADFLRIDPLLGTEEDLAALCAEGKKRGISVILDGVFSHTGDDSVYFNRKGRYPSLGAYDSQDSPYYKWYEFQKWPDAYTSWWNFDTLPNVDEANADYLRFICGPGGVLEHWLSLGVAGFRLDVADELPDVFIDALTHCVKSYNPDAVVIGEVWEDASNKISYGLRRRYFLGAQLDAVMNYPLRDAILTFIRYGNGQDLNEAILTILENYPRPVAAVLMNCLSTHDVERALTRLAGEPYTEQDRQWQYSHHLLSPEAYTQGKRLFELASVLQFFLPGIPSLYYGDEAGMTGYRDPFNRCCYPWGQVDEELLTFFRALARVRHENRALLADTDFLPVCFDCDIYAFVRVGVDERLFVAVNRGPQPAYLALEADAEILLGTHHDNTLLPYSYCVARL